VMITMGLSRLASCTLWIRSHLNMACKSLQKNIFLQSSKSEVIKHQLLIHLPYHPNDQQMTKKPPAYFFHFMNVTLTA
jgi:hypothetical protein